VSAAVRSDDVARLEALVERLEALAVRLRALLEEVRSADSAK